MGHHVLPERPPRRGQSSVTSDQEALLHLSRASDELRYANDARTTGNYGGAVSMSFYAVFRQREAYWPTCERPPRRIRGQEPGFTFALCTNQTSPGSGCPMGRTERGPGAGGLRHMDHGLLGRPGCCGGDSQSRKVRGRSRRLVGPTQNRWPIACWLRRCLIPAATCLSLRHGSHKRG